MHVFDAKAQFVAVSSAADFSFNTAPESAAIPEQTTTALTSSGLSEFEKLTDNKQSLAADAIGGSKINTQPEKPSYFDDAVSKSKLLTNKTTGKKRRLLWVIGSVFLLLIIVMQSIYFLRNQIAIHYPAVKPYLVNACLKLSCTISLPKQIEFIVIDDSDMQEDEQHPGVMQLSSNLINKSAYNQTYPNLELTLTDTDDKPVLRRIFKPAEYLPANTNIVEGFNAGAELRIKLAITTQNIAVSGYRLFVTY